MRRVVAGTSAYIHNIAIVIFYIQMIWYCSIKFVCFILREVAILVIKSSNAKIHLYSTIGLYLYELDEKFIYI